MNVIDPKATSVAQPLEACDRHRFVDALRGFALLGILLINIEYIVQHWDLGYSEFTSNLDRGVRWLTLTFVQQKMFLLFSLLFGYGLSLQLQRAASSSSPLGARYLRRMICLIALGLLHGLLFFAGDILVLYGLAGCVAYTLRKMSSRRLIITAGVIYLAAGLCWLALGALDAISPSANSEESIVGAVEILSSGSFSQVVQLRSEDWAFITIVLMVIQGPAILAMILLGIVLGRRKQFADPNSQRPMMHRLLRIAGGIGLIGSALGGALQVQGASVETLGFAISFLFAPFLTAAYIAALGLLLGSHPQRIARPLELGGRMSLSVYLLESIIATSLAYGYGAGMFGTVGPLAGVGLAVVIWACLMGFAVWWMKHSRFGPFEWLLRSVTYGKAQSIRL